VLSGGERLLLEISSALIMEPDVLLIDELSIGLDRALSNWSLRLCGSCATRGGKTLIFVEQNAPNWNSRT
jgi:branched-chain amino acid transport system ATP-binding protein